MPGLRAKCPVKKKYIPTLEYPAPTKLPCCLTRILSNHKDFFKQRSTVKTLIKGRGHKYVFLPKFYYEVNPIEIYQGYGKTRYRQVKKTSFQHAKEEVVKALEACLVKTIRRFYNRTLRQIDAYRQGLSIKQAAQCVKKQRRHRTISKKVIDEQDKQLKKHLKR